MTRLFISHSSKDNDSAIALKVWLEQNGWIGEGDIYLDLDPEDGIAASERWLAAFNAANTRCEAVLFLVSRAWLDSKWCLDEYQVANNENKKLVPLLLENVTHSELPTGLTVQWQVVALWDQGGQTVRLVAKDKHTDKATVVHFSEAGLTALKRGLEKAGLTPESFDLCRDAAAPLGWRAPYRGLEALEEKDAAVFFGRDADIVRTIDTLRGLRSRSGPRMVVILGASGAGKSSFLRAGLLPRLKRDDACWLPLQPIRAAQGGAIEGREGLLAALEEVYLRIEERRSRADLRDQLESEATFIGLVNDVRRIGAERANVEAPPLVILSIDQAEELFATDTVGTGAERDAIRLLAFARAGIQAEALLVLATIRSDAWEKLQNARTLAGVRKELLSLEAVPQGEIARIIREPALKLREKVGLDAPVFAEDVVVELQKEVDRQEDALPLLAFALERLMREHSAARTIDMQFLRTTGGVTSAIDAAAEKAMEDAGLSHDASERREALRLAFVPHLVGIDPESKRVRRSVVLLRDIPQASGPLIETLTNRRLLVTKGEGDRTTIEVAHEALLRSWSSLATILADDAIDLVTLNKALSAAKDWEQLKDTQRRAELLFHSGFLLDDAQKLAAKGDAWAHMIAPAQSYLKACADREEEKRKADKALEDSFIDKQRRLASVVEERASERRFDAAMRIALAGEVDPESIKRGIVADPVRRASLARAAHNSRLVQILARHPEAIPSVAFSRDGRCFATGSQDGRARVFDAETGALIGERELHKGWINGVAFMLDGNRLVTGGRDKSIRVWDLDGSLRSYALEPTPDEVRCIAVSADGRSIATGYSNGYVEIWDAKKRRSRRKLRRHDGAVLGVAFSPDGVYLVTGGQDGSEKNQGRICVGKVTRKQCLWKSELLDGQIHGVAFSPDGLRVASAGYDGVGRVWDARTGLVHLNLQGHSGQLRSIAFSHDGRRLATSSGDETVRVWDAQHGRQLSHLAGHDGWVHSVAFNNDGSRLGSGGFDCTARIWDTGAGSEIARTAFRGNLGSIGVSADGSLLAAASSEEPVRIWNTKGPPQYQRLPRETVGAKRIAFAPDGQHLELLSNDGALSTWALKSGKGRPHLTGLTSRACAAAFSGDGSLVAVAQEDGTIEIYDRSSGARIVGPISHPGEVTDLAFSSGARTIASTGGDGSVYVWSIENGTQPLWGPIRAHTKSVRRVAFSPDGKVLVSAGNDRRAYVWDAATGKKIDELHGHTDQVMDMCYNSEGTRLATACRDRIVRLFNTADHRVLASFPVLEHATAVAFHPMGIFLAASAPGARGDVRVWDTVFLAALTGERLARAVAANRLKGAEVLAAKEASDLSQFGVASDDTTMNVAQAVLALHGATNEIEDHRTWRLVDIWREHRQVAFELETRALDGGHVSRVQASPGEVQPSPTLSPFDKEA